MSGSDRKHVQTTKQVLYVDHRCKGDLDGQAFWQELPVNAEDYVQVFVSIAKYNLFERVLEESEDSDTVTQHVVLWHSRSIKVVHRTKILQAEELNDPISGTHGRIDPTRCFLGRCKEVLKRRALDPGRGYTPSVIKAGAVNQFRDSAVRRHFGFARRRFHAV